MPHVIMLYNNIQYLQLQYIKLVIFLILNYWNTCNFFFLQFFEIYRFGKVNKVFSVGLDQLFLSCWPISGF
jgi:hypothetical protein